MRSGLPLTLSLVGALAVGAALGRRGSRATDPTATPAFRRWFGDSQVVDAEGRPLVVYHGSPHSDIEAFEPPRHRRRVTGFFFTSSEEVAGEYGTSVYPVYLYANNPLVVDAKGADWSEIPQRAVLGGWDEENVEAARDILSDDDGGYTSTDRIAELAEHFGFDGAVIKNVIDSSSGDTYKPTTVYVVFDSTQIKSATRNTGAFDPADPRISFNRRRR